MLRIDHVMGLHRLYWIPDGFEAKEGVYVHYRAEELYAVLSLESHRGRAEIVGENLGTVPPYVNSAMVRHRIFGMHVSQFFVSADPSNALPAVEPLNVASLNTHDTPTFAGFWNEADIQDQLELGLVSDSEAAELRRERQQRREALINFLRSTGAPLDNPSDPGAVLEAWLKYLAQTDAAVLLLNLEDLCLEAAPQNVPGTWEERPNWQRKIRHPLASLPEIEPASEILKAIASMRPR
jgi:4-alpha-glucanotransferase